MTGRHHHCAMASAASSSSHSVGVLAEGKAEEGVRLIQLHYPSPRIIKVYFVEGLKAIILGFVGSVISLPEGITCFPSHAEAITLLTCCMDQLPGIWQVPIWQDIPIWLSAPVSCIAEQ